MSQSQRSILRKVLVVCELEENVSEKSASQEYEIGINEMVDFPCMVQVVSNIRRAYALTRMQLFDAIVVPQKIERPFGIKELDACIFSADGIHPNIICILDYEEDEHTYSADIKCKFVRNTEDQETPFDDVAHALSSFLFGEAQVEAELAPPMAHVTSSNASCSSVVADAVPVRPDKLVLPQTNDSASASSSNPPRLPPQMALPGSYGHPLGYPVPIGYAAPAVPSMQGQQRPIRASSSTDPDEASAWEAMHHRMLSLRQQEQQYLQQFYGQRRPSEPLPPSVSAAPVGAVTHGPRTAPQQQPHPMAPMLQAAHPMLARERSGASPGATPTAPPVSPIPQAKKRRFARPRTPTITYGPPTHTAVPNTTAPGGSPHSAVVSPQKPPRVSAAVDPVSTPEHSPSMPAVHSSQRAVHPQPLEISENSEDSEDGIVQSARRLSTRSPGQVIDPELLDSFLREER